MGLLMLSRKVGQSILIGPDIRITITQVVGGKVGIGVSAPLDLAVDRAEVRQMKDREKAREEAVNEH